MPVVFVGTERGSGYERHPVPSKCCAVCDCTTQTSLGPVPPMLLPRTPVDDHTPCAYRRTVIASSSIVHTEPEPAAHTLKTKEESVASCSSDVPFHRASAPSREPFLCPPT